MKLESGTAFVWLYNDKLFRIYSCFSACSLIGLIYRLHEDQKLGLYEVAMM